MENTETALKESQCWTGRLYIRVSAHSREEAHGTLLALGEHLGDTWERVSDDAPQVEAIWLDNEEELEAGNGD